MASEPEGSPGAEGLAWYSLDPSTCTELHSKEIARQMGVLDTCWAERASGAGTTRFYLSRSFWSSGEDDQTNH